MTDDSDNESESWDYDSGPFCRHWDSPCMCDIACAACGKYCGSHYENEDNCEWKEPS